MAKGPWSRVGWLRVVLEAEVEAVVELVAAVGPAGGGGLEGVGLLTVIWVGMVEVWVVRVERFEVGWVEVLVVGGLMSRSEMSSLGVEAVEAVASGCLSGSPLVWKTMVRVAVVVGKVAVVIGGTKTIVL